MRSFSLGLLLLASVLSARAAISEAPPASQVCGQDVTFNVTQWNITIGATCFGGAPVGPQGLIFVYMDSGSASVLSLTNSDGSACACTLLAAVSNGTATRVEAWQYSGVGPNGSAVTFTFSAPIKPIFYAYTFTGVSGFSNILTNTGLGNSQTASINIQQAGDALAVAWARQGSGRISSSSGCTIDDSGNTVQSSGNLQNVTSVNGVTLNEPSGTASCSVSLIKFQGTRLGDPWAGIALEIVAAP